MGHGLRSRLPRLALRCLAVAPVLAGSVNTPSRADTGDAAAACTQKMQDLDAREIRDVDVRRDGNVQFVHGVAKFGGSAEVRFRCRVYKGKVLSVRHLVRDPTIAGGWVWVAGLPRGAGLADAREKEAAGPPPPRGPVSPRFMRPPG